jgi:hypothetical protein
MSACARCRWGPGTTSERPPNTENAKQLEGGLAAMLAARQAQDCTYFPSSTTTTFPLQETQSSMNHNLGNTQVNR